MKPIDIHDQIEKAALKRPRVKQAYDEMDEEFSLLKTMLEARLAANKTQEQVAEAMKTKTSVIGRLETGGGKRRHSPTLNTLRKYAEAIGCILSISFTRRTNSIKT